MRSSLATVPWIRALSVTFGVTNASNVLGTVTPCPRCPKSIMPKPIAVTSQYQPVSTCIPTRTCSAVPVSTQTTSHSSTYTTAYSTTHCQLQPSCSTFDWVSTTVPCLGGATSTLVTSTHQKLELAHVSTVLTTYSPCKTQAPLFKNGTAERFANSTAEVHKNASCISTTYQTMIVDLSAPYDECGPLALPPWDGSGLCTDCTPNAFTTSQVVDVHKCLDGKCSDYVETWVSVKPTKTASSARTAITTHCSLSSGVNTVPITTTIQPSGNPDFTSPVTTTCHVTTSVSSACITYVTTTVTVTFTAEPKPCQTVVSGTTQNPTAPATNPAYPTSNPTGPAGNPGPTSGGGYLTGTNGGMGPSGSGGGYSTGNPTNPAGNPGPTSGGGMGPSGSGGVTYSTGVGPTVTTPGGTTSTPKPPTDGDGYDYLGCFGSDQGFPTFHFGETNARMDVQLCTSECRSEGSIYAGIYEFDCYCALTLGSGTADLGTGTCNIPCPGDSTETCGGNTNKRRRNVPAGRALDMYEVNNPTSTSSTSTSTSSGAPDPSSDPDPEPRKRDIEADIEISKLKARSEVKIRHGGMLRNAEKAKKAPLVKRDFGVKQLFGL